MSPRTNLKAFARERRRNVVDCKLCKLPAGAIKQIRERDTKVVKLVTVFAWIKEVYHVTVTEDEYNAHTRSGHERR